MAQQRGPRPHGPPWAQLRLSVFFGAIFLVVGLHTPYWPVWIEARGIDAAGVGTLVAVGLVMRVISGPLLGAMADRLGERRRPIIVLAGLSILSFCLFFGVSGFWGVLVVTVLSMTFYPALIPLIETLAVASAREQGFDYGRTRLWGSLTFIAANLAGGALLTQFGPNAILPAILTVLALTAAAGFGLPPEPRGGHAPARQSRAEDGAAGQKAVLRVFVASPFFWLFALSGGLIQASHAVYYGFASIHWQAQGFSGTAIGGLWAIGVLAEVVLFSVSGRVLARIGALGLLAIGAGAAAVRWSVLAFDPPLALLAVTQILHAGTFGATHLGAIHLIDRAVPQRFAVTAQSLYFALSGGILLGALTLSAGHLYGAVAGRAYLAMAAAGLVSLIGVGLLARAWTSPLLVREPVSR